MLDTLSPWLCVCAQVEDPTPELQRVREKVELEALLACDWVVQQAQQVCVVGVTGSTHPSS
jgi:histone acetyltransferase 1